MSTRINAVRHNSQHINIRTNGPTKEGARKMNKKYEKDGKYKK
jgi:hypothetical protein